MSEWRCPECDTANDGTTSACVVCDAPRTADRPADPRPVAGLPVRPVRRPGPEVELTRWRVAGVALVVLAGLVGGGYLLSDAGADSATGPAAPSVTPVGWTPSETPPEPEPAAEEFTPTAPGQIGLVSIESADPRATYLAALFDTYFTGINAHDASVATRVFAPGGVVDPAAPGQVADFGADIATTRDSNIRLLAVADDPHAGEVIATLSFTSTQDPGFGPPERPDETCTDWRLDFRLTSWEGDLLIFGTAPGAVSAPCA
jgi:hypothetical protein